MPEQIHPDLLVYYIDQYQAEMRRISLQERAAEYDGLQRKNPLGDNGSRFLVMRNNRAVYRSSDIGEAIDYIADHPGCTVVDLAESYGARLIGQFLGVRESLKSQPPRERRIQGATLVNAVNDKGELLRDADNKRIVVKTQLGTSLLKDRKTVVKIPPSRDWTPMIVQVERLMAGKPAITSGPIVCPKCGYGRCVCALKNPTIHPVQWVNPNAGRIVCIPLAELWISEQLSNQEFKNRLPQERRAQA